ncbi:MAG: electron transfer flavoprotein subunit beta/FixA family protein [Leptospirales bacterium]|nr:electron transfer flavoprotein subunit beta/FixA family protein [Leptospirales bacterium]
MKIVVCLKQVPDMESKFKIVDDKKVDESQIAFKINDFDNYAVEAALQLKEKHGGEVVIVSAGPDRAAKEIRQAFAMGADWGLHITDPAIYDGDSFVIASALTKAIESIGGVDLVMTGAQTEDMQAAVTGVMIADMLNVPHCTSVVKINTADGKAYTLNRELEGGFNEVVELAAPAVLTIQSGINEPRYPTLPGIMKAKKKQLDAKSGGDLGVSAASRTAFIKMFVPVSDSMAEIIEGAPAEAAAKLVDKLKNEAKVI